MWPPSFTSHALRMFSVKYVIYGTVMIVNVKSVVKILADYFIKRYAFKLRSSLPQLWTLSFFHNFKRLITCPSGLYLWSKTCVFYFKNINHLDRLYVDFFLKKIKSEANYNTANTFSKFTNPTISKLKVERLETHKTKIASLLVANRNNNSSIIDLNLVGLTQH